MVLSLLMVLKLFKLPGHDQEILAWNFSYLSLLCHAHHWQVILGDTRVYVGIKAD